MAHRARLSSLVVALAVVAALWAPGCKQGEGERCQTKDDCVEPLSCNLATLTCASESTAGQFDATIADGPPIDAPVDAGADAPTDAVTDATTDAMTDAAVDAMIDAPI